MQLEKALYCEFRGWEVEKTIFVDVDAISSHPSLEGLLLDGQKNAVLHFQSGAGGEKKDQKKKISVLKKLLDMQSFKVAVLNLTFLMDIRWMAATRAVEKNLGGKVEFRKHAASENKIPSDKLPKIKVTDPICEGLGASVGQVVSYRARGKDRPPLPEHERLVVE